MRLLAVTMGWFLVADAVALPGWDDLFKQMVSQAFPVLLGFLVHWLGVRTQQKGSADVAPSPSGTP